MVKVHQGEAAADPSEFVRAWALADGTRCVLAVVGPLLELRIVNDDLIVRHARFTEMQRALDAAQLWRIECDRWNEDGLLGMCDRHQHICVALALWNGRDPFLKERLFGVTNPEGNHGEDVKECYFYLDNTPTHSYVKALYKYPQAAFPYAALVTESQRRGRDEGEYELLDTGVFEADRYFDVQVEYAKADAEDILIRYTVTNRGPDRACLDVLPTIWFRNTWSWSSDTRKPELRRRDGATPAIELDDATYGRRWLSCVEAQSLLFTDNETNRQRLFGGPNPNPYVKDAFYRVVVERDQAATNPLERGTKAAVWYALDLAAGDTAEIRLRFSDTPDASSSENDERFSAIFDSRIRDTDEFYAQVFPAARSSDEARNVARQALAGLLWSKQFYHHVVREWLHGDPRQPPPPPERRRGRNADWGHVYNDDVLLVPDTWEYPWYASWDLAFQSVALALVDADFAKDQLVLLLREWYMHPNGQLPAYEWNLGDVNPPVHAWAAWRVYKIEQKRRGVGDRVFLERVFQKLLLNFTWWVNRANAEGLSKPSEFDTLQQVLGELSVPAFYVPGEHDVLDDDGKSLLQRFGKGTQGAGWSSFDQGGVHFIGTNRDDVPHNIVSTERKFKSPVLDTDQTFSHTFDAPGTYKYYCSIHPKMTGEVVVS